MVLAALDQAGGVKYLSRQAVRNPAAFLSLVGRIIPSQVRASLSGGDDPIAVQHFESIKDMSFEERKRRFDEMIEAAKHGPIRFE